jgi:hypothetical protein
MGADEEMIDLGRSHYWRFSSDDNTPDGDPLKDTFNCEAIKHPNRSNNGPQEIRKHDRHYNLLWPESGIRVPIPSNTETRAQCC